MVKTRPTGLLNIPNLAEPTGASFDTRARAIKSWLNALPMGDAVECGQRVGQVLNEVNRLNIPISNRLYLLEQFSKSIAEITKGLSFRYSFQNLPLNEKSHNAAALTVFLYRELAVGYKIIIEQTWDKKINFLNSRGMTSNIYYAMSFLRNVLLASYEIYQDPPSNTWTHIHQLYLYAEENELLHVMPRNMDDANPIEKSTIDELYKQTILLGLLCPYRLRQVDIKKVVSSLKDWSKHCKILSADSFSTDSGYVLIRMNSDLAPSFHFTDSNINHVYSRTLDTRELVDTLTDQLSIISTDGRGNTSFHELPENVIKLLVNTWSGNATRLYNRKSRCNSVRFSAGIADTYQMINKLQQEHQESITKGVFAALVRFKSPGTEPDFQLNRLNSYFEDSSTLTLEPSSHDTHTNQLSSTSTLKADVWDKDYASKSLGYSYNLKQRGSSTPLEEPEQNDIPLGFTGNNQNESVNGFCFLTTMEGSANSTKAKIGDIVGIHDESAEDQLRVAVGIIRRMRYLDDKTIELGVQKLAPIADIVATCHVHEHEFNPKYLRGFVVPSVKSMNLPCTLLLNTKYKVGEKLILNKLGFKIQVKLTKLADSTGAFNRFEFGIIKMIGTSTGENPIQDQQSEAVPHTSAWTLI